jgi:GTP-binding protein
VKFVDEATIIVQSGDGGRGCVSFRRERSIPRGGPDGGDGGKGGNVILKATSSKHTLYHLQFKKKYRAANGSNGQGNQKTGRRGDPLIIDVPVGTLIIDGTDGTQLYDLSEPDQEALVAEGGRGGLGNLHFKSSTNRAPRHAQPGESGKEIVLKLELKLMATVGIVGLPNAGKSTLLSALSAARPKIASYPFTTLTPNLGVMFLHSDEPVVVADIPGLIAGAHTGAGLGIRFLRHVERTRILLHLIDASALDPSDPLQSYRAINHELAMHGRTLAQKPQVVVLNKLDIEGADPLADQFCQAIPDRSVIRISAAAQTGLDALTVRIREELEALNESQ